MDPHNRSEDGPRILDGAQAPETSTSDIDLYDPIIYTAPSSCDDAIFSLPQTPQRHCATPALTRSTYTSSTTSSSRSGSHHLPPHSLPLEPHRDLVPSAPPEIHLYPDILPELDAWDLTYPGKSYHTYDSELRSTSIPKGGDTLDSVYYSSIDSVMGDILPDSRGLIEVSERSASVPNSDDRFTSDAAQMASSFPAIARRDLYSGIGHRFPVSAEYQQQMLARDYNNPSHYSSVGWMASPNTRAPRTTASISAGNQSLDTAVTARKQHSAKEHPGESVDNLVKAARDQWDECETPPADESIERSIVKPFISHIMRNVSNASCPECGKEVGRESDLKKHMRRHTKPYGCIWDGCDKSFGSKNDWRRHEQTKHGHLLSKDFASCYRCIGDHSMDDSSREVCLKAFYGDREEYREHLSRTGAQTSDEFIDSRCVASDLRGPFWCGFCNDVIAVSREKDDTGGERVRHIADHFVKENMNSGDWYELNGSGFTKKELLKREREKEAAVLPNTEPATLHIQESAKSPQPLIPQLDRRDVLDHTEERKESNSHLSSQTPYSDLPTSEGGSLKLQSATESPPLEMQLDTPSLQFPILGASCRAGTTQSVTANKEQRSSIDQVLSLTRNMQDSPSSRESGTEASETSTFDYTSYESNSSELRSFTIGCAVLVHILHKMAASKPDMSAPSGSSSNGIVSFFCQPQANSSQQTSTGQKRKNDGFKEDDDERDDLPGRKRQQKDDNAKDDSVGPRLACPFNKYNPHLFGPSSPEADYHNCGLFNCETIAQLKQHLARAHYMPPFYCYRCCERGFRSHGEVIAHYRRQPNCEILEPALYTERISNDLIEELELGKRNAKGTDPVRYWHKLYDRFFPGDAELRLINPYYEGPLAEYNQSLLNFSEQVLVDLVPVLTQRLGLGEAPWSLQRDIQHAAVQQFLVDILQRHREALRNAMLPQLGHRSMNANRQRRPGSSDGNSGPEQVPQETQLPLTNAEQAPEPQQGDLEIDDGVQNLPSQHRPVEGLPQDAPDTAGGSQDAIAGSEDDLFSEVVGVSNISNPQPQLQAATHDLAATANFDFLSEQFLNEQAIFLSSPWEMHRHNFDLDAMIALAAQESEA